MRVYFSQEISKSNKKIYLKYCSGRFTRIILIYYIQKKIQNICAQLLFTTFIHFFHNFHNFCNNFYHNFHDFHFFFWQLSLFTQSQPQQNFWQFSIPNLDTNPTFGRVGTRRDWGDYLTENVRLELKLAIRRAWNGRLG